MAKLEKVENGAVIHDDGSGAITLSDGKTMAFRAPTIGDFQDIRNTLRNAGVDLDDELELAIRLAARCCIKYGTQPDINMAQLRALPLKELGAISEGLAPFMAS
jgi:hypothetical protein